MRRFKARHLKKPFPFSIIFLKRMELKLRYAKHISQIKLRSPFKKEEIGKIKMIKQEPKLKQK